MIKKITSSRFLFSFLQALHQFGPEFSETENRNKIRDTSEGLITVYELLTLSPSADPSELNPYLTGLSTSDCGELLFKVVYR